MIVIGRRAGRGGLRRASGRERPRRRDRRARARRRRVLLLRVHALEGVAAARGSCWPRCARARSAPRRRPASSTSPRRCGGGTRSSTSWTTRRTPWLEERRRHLVRGQARIVGERRLAVDGDALGARRGSSSPSAARRVVPPIPGLDGIDSWTNREATTATRGARAADRDRRRRRRGRARPGVVVARLEGDADRGGGGALPRGAVRLRAGHRGARERGVGIEHRGTGEEVSADGEAIVVSSTRASAPPATGCSSRSGRKPRTAELGLEEVGLEAGQADRRSTARCARGADRTGSSRSATQCPHAADAHWQVPRPHVADVILGRVAEAGTTAHGRLSPRVVFTEPQVAAVGHTLASATRPGSNVRAVDQASRTWRAGASSAVALRAPRGSSSTRPAACSSAPPSPASRSPTSCTRSRSPSSAKCRWSGSGTRCRRSPPAARSGCACWRSTGLRTGPEQPAAGEADGPVERAQERR